jgi:signal peptidase I
VKLTRPRFYSAILAAAAATGSAPAIGTTPPAGSLQTAKQFRMSSVVMEPTLRLGETFLARTGEFGPIERGGVYVVRKRGVDYVARVIGLPGDQFEITGGGMFLKDSAAHYSNADIAGSMGTCAKGPPLIRREHLPGGASHLIMACNYSFGSDQPPIIIPADHYFLMGDNRSNAADSRFDRPDMGLGLVPLKDFVGKAERIFLSSDSTRIGKEID